ncbi:MAG: hypothetical protein QIT36_gp037 [Methanophagales virus GBV301]|uniref:Uncharacterized protein n=1 Tax=Methanophagales virus GBV301 TaxID=2999280 RepID=A0A9E9A632_9CAUD|nr:MAG: hypothetical protein QIT36_gp037 [Methanophagales virus GBV301]WAE39461.1 MAG: hypothetical protein LDLAKGPJ_00037 [Methanophagales virus GBV301]
MRIIPFYSRSLVFRFERRNRLLIIDYFYLPSKRFVSQIYFYKRKVPMSQVSLPSKFETYPEFAIIILNKDSEVLSRPVECIRCRVGISVVMGSYQDSADELGQFLVDGHRRMKNRKIWEIVMRCPITGALIYYNKNERQEAVEIGSGLLSVLSPKEILGRYL